MMMKSLVIGISIVFVVATGYAATHFLCLEFFSWGCNNRSIQAVTYTDKELAQNYFEYTPSKLSAELGNGTLVLYFWAPWCTSCSALDIDLQNGTAEIPNGITLLRVNYDQESKLKQKYSIITQHTFVQIDQNGEAISTWVGGDIIDFSRHIK